MALFVYGALLRERGLEMLCSDFVESTTPFRKAAGVYEYLSQDVLPPLEPKLPPERPPEATPLMASIMRLVCLAEAHILQWLLFFFLPVPYPITLAQFSSSDSRKSSQLLFDQSSSPLKGEEPHMVKNGVSLTAQQFIYCWPKCQSKWARAYSSWWTNSCRNEVGNLKEEIELFNQMKDSGYVSDMIACSIHMLAPCKQGTFQMPVDWCTRSQNFDMTLT